MKTPSIWLSLAAVILVIVATATWFANASRSDSPDLKLKTVRLEKGNLLLSIPATGVVEPLYSLELKSKASGEIAQILVEEGGRVKKGDVIIKIDPGIEEIAVRRAEANLMVAMASVKKGEILLRKARLARSRKEKLYSKGLISEEAHEGGRHDAALRDADLSLAQAEGIRAQEALTEARARLSETQVSAPLSGVILSLDVQRGQIISSGTSSFSQGTPLAVIGDLSELRIKAEVDETDARKLAVSQEAIITFDAFPDLSYRGRVIRIAPLAKMKNDLAVVELLLSLGERVDPTGDAPKLRPGLSADVEVITQRLNDVMLLSRDAVHKEDGKWGISVVQGEQVSFQEVTTGISDGEQIEIKSDLPEGTEVVLNWAATAGASSEKSGRPGRP